MGDSKLITDRRTAFAYGLRDGRLGGYYSGRFHPSVVDAYEEGIGEGKWMAGGPRPEQEVPEDNDERIEELEEELQKLRKDFKANQSLVSELEEELELLGGALQANDARRFLPRHGRNWGGPAS